MRERERERERHASIPIIFFWCYSRYRNVRLNQNQHTNLKNTILLNCSKLLKYIHKIMNVFLRNSKRYQPIDQLLDFGK